MKCDSQYYVNIQHQTPIYVAKTGIVVRPIGVNIFFSLEKNLSTRSMLSHVAPFEIKIDYLAKNNEFEN